MECEICKIIETHGLDRSVHDWWHCADAAKSSTACRSLISKQVFSLRKTYYRLRFSWTRLFAPRTFSKPQAISRELKLLSYVLAAQIGTQLK